MTNTTIKRIDRDALKALRVEIQNALDIIAARHGIKMTCGNASFTPRNATFKLELATIGEAGAVNTPESEAFKTMAKWYGLEADDLGRTFTYANQLFTITGLKPKTKYPILATRADGRMMKFPADMVKNSLTPKATPATPNALGKENL